ncbi:hypothetical protein Tco_1145123 [Tanacetum coccineum]
MFTTRTGGEEVIQKWLKPYPVDQQSHHMGVCTQPHTSTKKLTDHEEQIFSCTSSSRSVPCKRETDLLLVLITIKKKRYEFSWCGFKQNIICHDVKPPGESIAAEVGTVEAVPVVPSVPPAVSGTAEPVIGVAVPAGLKLPPTSKIQGSSA